MRIVPGVLAFALLSACDAAAPAADKAAGDPAALASAEATAALAATGNSIDYRYAFKLAGGRVKPALQEHADACDKLGPAHCRIQAMRYRVDDSNHVSAVLTFVINPGIARAFGENAIKQVQAANGVLVDSAITGPDATGAARSNALIGRLRDQLSNAEAQLRANGADAGTARARADRIRAALATIAEVEAGQGQTLATAPVLITYSSGNGFTALGGSTDANFREAGDTLLGSLAGMAQVLANIGPWILLLLVLVFVLRLIVHGTGGGGNAEPYPADGPNAVPVPAGQPRENRGMMQRWFGREENDPDAE